MKPSLARSLLPSSPSGSGGLLTPRRVTLQGALTLSYKLSRRPPDAHRDQACSSHTALLTFFMKME